MSKSKDYVNNIKTVMEISGVDAEMFDPKNNIDKEIFYHQLELAAEKKVKETSDATLTEIEFNSVVDTTQLMTIDKSLKELVELGLIVKEGSTYVMVDEDKLPDWVIEMFKGTGGE